MSREIPLTHGQVALVSDEDYERVSQFKWRANWDPSHSVYYAVTNFPIVGSRGLQKQISMARFVLDAPEGKVVDHHNHDTLDNRRENLRLCSSMQNSHNARKYKSNTSGFIGVIWCAKTQKWSASVMHDGKRFYLGHFDNIIEAARARDDCARRLHGEFAFLNFTEGEEAHDTQQLSLGFVP